MNRCGRRPQLRVVRATGWQARHLRNLPRRPQDLVASQGHDVLFAARKGKVVHIAFVMSISYVAFSELGDFENVGRPLLLQHQQPQVLWFLPHQGGSAQRSSSGAPAGVGVGGERAADAEERETAARRAPSPRAAAPDAGLGLPPLSSEQPPAGKSSGASSRPGSSTVTPPGDGRLQCLRQGGAPREPVVPPVVEDIGQDPPHPCERPEILTHSYIRRGDQYDEVVEEDVEPMTKALQEDIAWVHAGL